MPKGVKVNQKMLKKIKVILFQNKMLVNQALHLQKMFPHLMMQKQVMLNVLKKKILSAKCVKMVLMYYALMFGKNT